MAHRELLNASDIARCTHRVALERGAPDGVAPLPVSLEIQRRWRDSNGHRDHVLSELLLRHADSVDAHGDVRATQSAVELGVVLIANPRLPDDVEGRRRAMVDVLIRTSGRGATAAYAPVLIRNSEFIEVAATRRILTGTLDNIAPGTAEWSGGFGVRRNDTVMRNGLQLSHATRVLETLAWGSTNYFGGVIDRQSRLWWIDLADADNPRFNLTTYDEAYAVRRDVLERHDRWSANLGEFPTSPYWHRDCPECPFAESCESTLVASDDVSLARFTTLEQQVLLREHGITTRAALSQLDPQRARRAKVTAANSANPAIEDTLGHAIEKLDELIYRARAHVVGSPLRIVETSRLHCPTADVEIDIDMESYNDQTYLWGAYVTLRRPVPGIEPGYHYFARFEAINSELESEVFGEFWTWLTRQRDAATAAGATLAGYCFWAQAENSAMNRSITTVTPATPTLADLDHFRNASPAQWVDLHEVAKGQIQTEGPLGLKVLAKAAGFEWRDPTPSGELSMLWFEEAISSSDPERAASNRRRLLEYNEDDCRATQALREWINLGAGELRSRDETPLL